MQLAASAPWRKAQTQSSEHAKASFRPPPGLEHLRCMEAELPAPPPGLENIPSPPFGLEIPHAPLEKPECSSRSTTAASECSTSLSELCDAQEYKVLLQNLPQCVLNNATIRAFVKELGIPDIKKLSFKHDGRALIVVSTYDAVRHCLALFPDHSSSMPWFYSSMLPEQRITATEVKSKKSNTGSLSADAPCFVPSSVGWEAQVSDNVITATPTVMKANENRQSMLSAASTDVSSLDGESSLSDSEAE